MIIEAQITNEILTHPFRVMIGNKYICLTARNPASNRHHQHKKKVMVPWKICHAYLDYPSLEEWKWFHWHPKRHFEGQSCIGT
jgi:hypothetical protein